MKCYEMFELTFSGPEPEGSWAETDITGIFRCGDDEKTVKGFYDGDGIYKVRFLPQRIGTYRWKVEGAVQAEGTEECTASDISHGMIRAVGTHFEYEDGTKYLPFGTTVYALAHQTEDMIEQTLESLAESPFNKVRHCIFPKHYDYNHNDPEFYPFEKDTEGKWDVHHPCLAYWRRFEKIILKMGEMGIETDLILFHPYDRWGFAFLNMEECMVYLDYVMRRLAAYPYIWWSIANEYDIMFHRTIEDWYRIEGFITEGDPYRHLLSSHNCLKLYNFSRPSVTHCCVQTIAMYKADEWQKRFQKPVVYDECCYEGNLQHEWGNISGFEMVNRFWCACVKGAYATHGETFLDDQDVLWWAKGGKLKGKSPKRIAFLKDLMYSLPSYMTPWEEPFWEDFEKVKEAKMGDVEEHPYFKLMDSMDEENREILQIKDAKYTGCCGEEVFLKYYARQCARVSSIHLPKDKKYRIEVIDVWNMTRETLLEEAGGTVEFQMPGKEGIAVLAVRTD
ncbi:DUF5605 domain-containing protein [Faecalicatena orotica]|uniref:Uncharacterized protein DUF5060 n=1 Tax=Faecalicatena orotica TaxID=1544 RepID=A0A2Y9BEJ7_9FIRM|nr:DUF5060 domain-containing protein [Faecalicatena orotica]PWJ28888.1 uncharacterized protein DUF5060 [Faecalicatena orotica]SSA56057.1 protein of unknown function [Faecalicatena orotica]